MDTIIQIGAQLPFVFFNFYVLKWAAEHFTPHIVRLLEAIEHVQQTGHEMAETGLRLVTVMETLHTRQLKADEMMDVRHAQLVQQLDRIEHLLNPVTQLHVPYSRNE